MGSKSKFSKWQGDVRKGTSFSVPFPSNFPNRDRWKVGCTPIEELGPGTPKLRRTGIPRYLEHILTKFGGRGCRRRKGPRACRRR